MAVASATYWATGTSLLLASCAAPLHPAKAAMPTHTRLLRISALWNGFMIAYPLEFFFIIRSVNMRRAVEAARSYSTENESLDF